LSFEFWQLKLRTQNSKLMSQSLVFTLLALALALPVLGAVTLRVLASRMSPPQLYGAAALIFGVAIASVLLLARANVASLQIGDLSLLLPAAAPAAEEPAIRDRQPATRDQQPTAASAPTAALPTAAPTILPTAAPTAAPTTPPTEAPTATPTAELPTPTTEPPTPTPQPAGQRTYIVQPGDTLRAIAEQFNVSVQTLIDANNLTPEQADALRVGQELIIP
jgi:LysM repeat protein